MNVFNDLQEVRPVADEAIPILAVPDGAGGGGGNREIWVRQGANACGGRVANREIGVPGKRVGVRAGGGVATGIADFAGGEFFPGSDELRDSPSRHRLEKGVYMIRHDNPRQQAVTLRIKSQQRALYHGGDGGPAKDAGA